MPERRRTFGPVVALGVGGAVLAAVAGSKTVMAAEDAPDLAAVGGTSAGTATLPLATTLALVVLAAWGVVLVTRGGLRRAVTLLGAAAAVGVLASLVSGWWMLPDEIRDGFAQTGFEVDAIDVSAWYWLGLVGALAATAAAVSSVVLVPTWPEMGRRYDSPTGAVTATDDDEATDLELWKAMDQGRDPTA